MNLRFSEHLTAKTSRGFRLKIYPEGRPEDFLVQREDVERGEGSASTFTYEFPDNLVVVARREFGSSVADPDDPGDVLIEVNIGLEASDEVAAIAEAEAREMAAEAGIEEGGIDEDRQDDDNLPVFSEFSGFYIIRHQANSD